MNAAAGGRPRIAAVVLAAGGAERFGAPKQLAPYRGRPLLEHVLAAAAAADLDEVVVVLGAHADAIERAVDLHGARVAHAADWAEGQAASLRAGVAALAAGTEAAVVLLGDQPTVGAADIAAVLAGRDPARFDAVRATAGGAPSHPVVLERALLDRAGELHGDAGFRTLLARHDIMRVELGPHPDIDTPDQLEALNR